MGTTSEKLNYLNRTKESIAQAIRNKGVDILPQDTFRSYAKKINLITAGIGETEVGNIIRMIDLTSTLPNQECKLTETDYLQENVETMLNLLELLVNGGN
ncbi:MAG: hypothetical protein IKA31_02050 [Clostridia bacterium]|nr:hypothetical protein [Clostridia bacterium]